MKQLIKFSVKFLVLISFCLPPVTGCKTEVNAEYENPAPYLEEITISDLTKAYMDGSLTIERVVGDYLERIAKLDRSGPMLNSVIVVNPDALEIARALDKELSQGKVRGPMHGIPVILKDNLDTYDKMPTTAGSVALKNSIAPKDSRIAQMLREAGAVIIAKSNLSEWANFRSKFSSSGWSGVGGQTKNPYILDRNPCGSSSGSAVAVSANLCALAIGTETNGSIVCPSNNNGIVGIKPTVGLLSRSGIIPISFTQDTPGPMGRVVADVAVALGVMTGVDSSDLKTLNPDAKFLKDYTQFLNADGLKGKRIGRLKNISGYHHRVDTLMDSAVEYIKSAGAEVVDIQFPLPAGSGAASFQIMLYEFKDGLNKYFASLGESAAVKNMDELIAFNLKDSVELRYFDQNLLITANEKGPIDSPEYKELLDRMFKAIREDGIDKVMSENNLDLLIAPTGSPAWKTDPINGDKFMGGSSSYAAISGYPSITVPMGFIDRVPVGISFVGRAWSEPLLIETAYSFEQRTKQRRAPQYFAK